MITASGADCVSMSTGSNEIAVVDEHGNTVGMLVSNQQPQAYALARQSESVGLHLKYPVPCSKLANVTVDWLNDNFEENPLNSLPRSVMFEEYSSYCYSADMKPFNQAVFGKIVRACFPNLTTRRLGIRGQSRYHYAGLGLKITSRYVERFRAIRERRNVARAVNSLRRRNGKCGSYKSDRKKHLDENQDKENYPILLDAVSLILPPYPTEDDIDARFEFPTHLLRSFLGFYRDYNRQFLGYIISLDFDKTMVHLRNFASRVPQDCRSMLQTKQICDLLALCDDIMYQEATAALLPDCLATLTTEFNVAVRKYAKTLPSRIGEPCNYDATMHPLLVECRVRSARGWSEYVRRVTTLCHVAKEARKTLMDQGIVRQLLRDLRNISMNDTVEQCAFAGCCDDDDDIDVVRRMTSYDRQRADDHVKHFCKLLEQKASVEKFAARLETIIDIHAGMKPEPDGEVAPLLADSDFDVITRQTRLFVMKWSMYASKMLTEITLRSSESVGTFHLVMLLFGDYVNHVICLRQERANLLKRQCSVIRKGSPYFKQLRASTSAQNAILPTVAQQQHHAIERIKKEEKLRDMQSNSYISVPSGAGVRQQQQQQYGDMGGNAYAAFSPAPPQDCFAYGSTTSDFHHHAVAGSNPARFVSSAHHQAPVVVELVNCGDGGGSYYLVPGQAGAHASMFERQ